MQNRNIIIAFALVFASTFQLKAQYSTVSLEPKTRKHAWLLGIPYGNSFEAPNYKF